MHVTFAQTRIGDPDELGAPLQFADIRRPDIAHRSPEAADKLMENARYGPLVGDLCLDPFRHQLEAVSHLLLKIAIGRAARHCADRAHAAIALVAAALI